LVGTAAIIGFAATLLWLRARWWDRRGKSTEARERYYRKLNVGSSHFFVVFELLIGIGILAKASRGGRPGEYISYALVGLLFVWFAYKRRMQVVKRTRAAGTQASTGSAE
jgi:hypothetical protein